MTLISEKTVVVTGASRGIGAATARFLAAEGAAVVLAARSADAINSIVAEITAAGGRALANSCDVANREDVQRLMAATHQQFGSVDVLINNAGLIEPIARIEDSDPDTWAHIVDVNLKGPYFALRSSLDYMLPAGGGTIINISSGAATGALEGWSHYCATKAALLSLTRCADKELRESGIRVIGLSPGTVATEMQVKIKASGINPVSQLDPSVHIPAEWVARAIGFLIGPGGDAYRGTDFSLKSNEERAAVGLPAPDH